MPYFKYTLDTLSKDWYSAHQKIREYFFKCEYDDVYSFIEFVANNYPDNPVNQKFMKAGNTVLERELSAYRFVGGKITEITSEEEISEIEEALQVPVSPVKEHLKCALKLLSDRKTPDYRNSIKESISAVESICKIICNDESATLGQALNKIKDEGNLELHDDLNTAFKKLYHYTSDEGGIRHGLTNEPNIYSEDAIFMLVSCSAFVNYLLVKSSKAGIKL